MLNGQEKFRSSVMTTETRGIKAVKDTAASNPSKKDTTIERIYLNLNPSMRLKISRYINKLES